MAVCQGREVAPIYRCEADCTDLWVEQNFYYSVSGCDKLGTMNQYIVAIHLFRLVCVLSYRML